MTMTFDELEKAYNSLKRVHDAMNTAYLSMEREIETIKMQNAILTAEKKQWEVEKVQQQMIIQQTLTSSNEVSNKYLEENKQLKEELKRLKG